MTVTIPTEHSYVNLLGQEVYFIEGANFGTRTEQEALVLMLHHTQGTDSRRYLASNPLKVSATYCIGQYPDTGNVPRIYKYMSERTAVPYTQGHGDLGGLPKNLNIHSISIEVEGPPFSDELLSAAAKLAASIIKDWHDARGRNLVLLGHDHTDDYYRNGRHTDPHFDWSRFAQQVYGFVGGLSGQVKGWGR